MNNFRCCLCHAAYRYLICLQYIDLVRLVLINAENKMLGVILLGAFAKASSIFIKASRI